MFLDYILAHLDDCLILGLPLQEFQEVESTCSFKGLRHLSHSVGTYAPETTHDGVKEGSKTFLVFPERLNCFTQLLEQY